MRRNTFSQMLATWLILGITLSIANTHQSYAQQSDSQVVDARAPHFTALVDSAMRCSLAGMHAAGIAILDQAAEVGAAGASMRQDVVLDGLRASMLSNLGLLAEAESLFRSVEDELKTIPYAPYGACLRAHLAVHHYRMGRREDAFNLITAAVRLKGNDAQCRAEASGFYHLAALHGWEGNHTEAREMFSMAVRTIDKAPQPGAAGACYWAALGEALDVAGERIEANRAYDRAYRHAISDSISAGRCAAMIAMRQADLLLRLKEKVKAKDMLRRAALHADPAAGPVLLGGIEELRARTAFGEGAVTTAQRLLAEALWHYFRGMTKVNCTHTQAECVMLRYYAGRAIDRAFTSLMHDGAQHELLASAAWNTYLALREFRGLPRCMHAVVLDTETHTWLQRRLANESRCLAGASGTAAAMPTGPTLRLLQRRLPRGASAVVIRRFMDRRQHPARSCYASVLLSDALAAIPRMIWLDATGAFDRTVLPRYLNHFADPRELWRSSGTQLPADAVRALPQDEDIWERCVAPLLRHLSDSGPLYLIPDGLYFTVNADAMFDPVVGGFLADRLRVHVLHAVGDGSAEAPRDDFTASMLVEDVPDAVRETLPAVSLSTIRAYGEETFTRNPGGVVSTNESRSDRGAESTSTTSIEDTAVQHIHASISEAELRARKLGRVFLLDLPTFLLSDTAADPVRCFLPWVPAADDPYIRTGLLLDAAPPVRDLFSRHTAMCGENDGVLLADEIAAMDFRSRQCIVLPRCDFLACEAASTDGTVASGTTAASDATAASGNTAASGTTAASGVSLLPHNSAAVLLQSFFHAGAPAVVHTLRPLPRAIRERFLGSFIDEFDGLNLDQAFRAARRAVRAAWPHPYFWGAFRLTRGRVPSL